MRTERIDVETEVSNLYPERIHSMRKMAPGQIEERYSKILSAWARLAPTKSFGGMTLAEFQARVLPSQTTRTQLETLLTQVTGVQEQRDNVDQISLEACDDVVKSVRADKSVGGDNGALYKEMGFVPKSERKTGLTRKKKTAAEEA
jgi:hypothetical protein